MRKIWVILLIRLIKSYLIPSLRNSLNIAYFKELDCMGVQFGQSTFFGRNIFPEGINKNMTTFQKIFKYSSY